LRLAGRAVSTATAEREKMNQEPAEFLDVLDELLDNPRYSWAFPTITGIKFTVKQHRKVTEGQRIAIENIQRRVNPDTPTDRFKGSRRYEGYVRPEGQ
jgi:hypothetical protein